MKKVTVPQLPQQGVENLELQFPDGWDVSVFDMAGCDKAPLSASDFRSALQKPLGAPTIREIAKGKKEVAIIFDDCARGSKRAKSPPSSSRNSPRQAFPVRVSVSYADWAPTARRIGRTLFVSSVRTLSAATWS